MLKYYYFLWYLGMGFIIKNINLALNYNIKYNFTQIHYCIMQFFLIIYIVLLSIFVETIIYFWGFLDK